VGRTIRVMKRFLLLACVLIFACVEANKHECIDKPSRYAHHKGACYCPSSAFEACGDIFETATPARISDKTRFLQGDIARGEKDCFCLSRPLCDEEATIRRRCDPHPEGFKERKSLIAKRNGRDNAGIAKWYNAERYAQDLLLLKDSFFNTTIEALNLFTPVPSSELMPDASFFEIIYHWLSFPKREAPAAALSTWTILNNIGNDLVEKLKGVQLEKAITTFPAALKAIKTVIKEFEPFALEAVVERSSVFTKYIADLNTAERDAALVLHYREATEALGVQPWSGILERHLLSNYLAGHKARLQIILKEKEVHGLPYAPLRAWRIDLPKHNNSYIQGRLLELNNDCLPVQDVKIEKALVLKSQGWIFDESTNFKGCKVLQEIDVGEEKRNQGCPDENSNIWCVNSFLAGLRDLRILKRDKAL